jgi:hypothetical protein
MSKYLHFGNTLLELFPSDTPACQEGQGIFIEYINAPKAPLSRQIKDMHTFINSNEISLLPERKTQI